jgi:hypothetical protein
MATVVVNGTLVGIPNRALPPGHRLSLVTHCSLTTSCLTKLLWPFAPIFVSHGPGWRRQLSPRLTLIRSATKVSPTPRRSKSQATWLTYASSDHLSTRSP